MPFARARFLVPRTTPAAKYSHHSIDTDHGLKIVSYQLLQILGFGLCLSIRVHENRLVRESSLNDGHIMVDVCREQLIFKLEQLRFSRRGRLRTGDRRAYKKEAT
jgi:hypothetical protein